MPVKQAITIKSQGDRINILLDESADFDTLTATLRKKMFDARQFFEGAVMNIAFQGRELAEIEKIQLMNVIATETTMKATLVPDEGERKGSFIPRLIQRVKTQKEPTVTKEEPKPAPVVPPTMGYDEWNTAYYQGGLRSGQTIKYDGSVVILGDANPGSEVIATGNVIVLGSLKGMAHAGCGGDTSCFVSAQVLLPTQLRIANLITYIPTPEKGKKELPKASIAYVVDGQVFVGPL